MASARESLCLLAVLLTATTAARAQQPLRSYAVEQEASTLWVVTHRAGLLGFLGHEHAILSTDWTATVCGADPVSSGAQASVTIPTKSLVIDSDSARALGGLGDGPGPEDREEIQRKLLAPEGLDAEAHPRIELRVDSVAPREGDGVRAFGRLTVRSVTRDIATTLDLEELEGGRLRISGKVQVRQTDFGIEPESVAGVVNVADEVDLYVRLVLTPTGEACPLR